MFLFQTRLLKPKRKFLKIIIKITVILPNRIDNNRKTTSNLGCFLCAQLLTVTKQRVGLSQTQLRIVLNDRCTQLPTVFRVRKMQGIFFQIIFRVNVLHLSLTVYHKFMFH